MSSLTDWNLPAPPPVAEAAAGLGTTGSVTKPGPTGGSGFDLGGFLSSLPSLIESVGASISSIISAARGQGAEAEDLIAVEAALEAQRAAAQAAQEEALAPAGLSTGTLVIGGIVVLGIGGVILALLMRGGGDKKGSN